MHSDLGANAPGSAISAGPNNDIAQIAKIGVWLDSTLSAADNEIFAIDVDLSRYRGNRCFVGTAPEDYSGFPWLFSRESFSHGLAPTIRIGETLMGTDKWEHYFQQGYWLWYWSNSTVNENGDVNARTLVDSAARERFSAYMEGNYDSSGSNEAALFQSMARHFDREYGSIDHFGSFSTGIVSHADIKANMQGFEFYEKLASEYENGRKYVFRISDVDVTGFNESLATPNEYKLSLIYRFICVDDSYVYPPPMTEPPRWSDQPTGRAFHIPGGGFIPE